MSIENSLIELKLLEKDLINDIDKDNKQIQTEFETLINKLINNTPTSELRNDLTNLNILFIQTLINYNQLQTIHLI